ncbi:Nuclease domain-containing protein [Trichinella britovi]|uniref:Staphylococcal nuclease domain-containing protein 1 n=2 Tax=Trichinella TaxID=6333 RepID=A0A0V1CW41_TRIBR|nr:Nuclease domain-containing protein [Trichinella britovi]
MYPNNVSSQTPQPAPVSSPPLMRGIGKMALGGDSIVIRGQPKGGPPPERLINLSNVISPKLARRQADSTATDSQDEPYAWEAREALRKLVVGHELLFTVDYKVPTSGREYGSVFVTIDGKRQNVAETLVSQGWLEVRQSGVKSNDDAVKRLLELQNTAKANSKGKWQADDATKHVRQIIWSTANPRSLVESFNRSRIKAVIEHVRDGCTVRAFLLPSFHYVTIMISGIRTPTFKLGEGGMIQDPEPFAEEAKFFTECRLLQNDVEVILEGASNQNFLGTVLHKHGNIAEALLKEGFAKCVDWSMPLVTSGPEKLREAERQAKERRLRLWKNYEPSHAKAAGENSFQAKVVEITLGDSMIIKKQDGMYQKIFLSSIRPPRLEDAGLVRETQSGRQFRPLYDIPFMFAAREVLRKKLIGKKVNVTIDYVQPSVNQLPERTCCTVVFGGQNMAELLVSKGLAAVVRNRQGDENRSPFYDNLLTAEAAAEKARLGIHSLKHSVDANHMETANIYNTSEKQIVRLQELQGVGDGFLHFRFFFISPDIPLQNVAKSKQFLPFLIRSGRTDGLVEFVVTGSRLRIFVPKESIMITLLLGGVSCPRPGRMTKGGGAAEAEDEPFSQEALQFTKDFCLQREVEFEVESVDKAGNFIGWCFFHGKNLSELLVENGLAAVHFTADRSKYGPALRAAELRAKEAKLKIWTLAYYDDETEELNDADDLEKGPSAAPSAGIVPERVPQYRAVLVTEICENLKFYIQYFDQGSQLEQMMKEMRTALNADPGRQGAFVPKKGDVCAALFSADQQWYRARVEAVRKDEIDVFYIDFGNRETRKQNELASLPAGFASRPPGARECAFALLKLPDDADYCTAAVKHFYKEVNGEQCLMNMEYRLGGVEYVTLLRADQSDIGKSLIRNGYCLVEQRRDRKMQLQLADYLQAQESAKSERLNIWQYGDFTGNEL